MSRIIDYGRTVLSKEARTLSALCECLGPGFESLVKAILELREGAKLVFSGVGKTGFVAQKISATFAGVGIPSFFLHPAEAVHGDLGRLTSLDLIVLFSNSGETSEVVRLLPAIKRIGCRICSVTSNPESMLGRHSSIVVPLGRIEEADPLGLAPTASTTAMLALGDALAMSVINERPISREVFALYHPGGTLGRTLLTVSEVMRRGEELCVAPESQTTRDVIHQITLTKGRPGAAAIVNRDGKLTGIFTDGDMRRLLDKRVEFLDGPISDSMSRNPKTVTADALAEEALKIMNHFKIDQVIAINEEGAPVGLVDIQDLVMSL